MTPQPSIDNGRTCAPWGRGWGEEEKELNETQPSPKRDQPTPRETPLLPLPLLLPPQAAKSCAHVLRLQVRDEHGHEGQELLHGELVPEGVDELDAVRPNDGPGVHVGVLLFRVAGAATEGQFARFLLPPCLVLSCLRIFRSKLISLGSKRLVD